MSGVSIKVKVGRLAGDADAVQRVRNGIADRRHLHGKMAVDAADFTRDFLRKSGRHATANRLKAKPTGFRAKNAKQVAADSNQEEAQVLIARSTGLGRAFHDMLILPGSGKTYLTIADHERTYGRSVRDFPEGTFRFQLMGRFAAFIFNDSDQVGYWLKTSVEQKQDRSLLPSDKGYAEVGSRSATLFINRLIQGL